jgi:hypothetical protein
VSRVRATGWKHRVGGRWGEEVGRVAGAWRGLGGSARHGWVTLVKRVGSLCGYPIDELGKKSQQGNPGVVAPS